MSRLLKVSDEVYEALREIKLYPSVSFSDVIKGLIEEVYPEMFEDDEDGDEDFDEDFD